MAWHFGMGMCSQDPGFSAAFSQDPRFSAALCESPAIFEHNKNTHNSANFQDRSRSKVVVVAAAEVAVAAVVVVEEIIILVVCQ